MHSSWYQCIQVVSSLAKPNKACFMPCYNGRKTADYHKLHCLNLELKIKVKLLFLLVTVRLDCIHYLADWPVAVFPCFLLSSLSRPQVRCFPFHFLPASPPEVQAGQNLKSLPWQNWFLLGYQYLELQFPVNPSLLGSLKFALVRISKSTYIEDRMSWTAGWIFLFGLFWKDHWNM